MDRRHFLRSSAFFTVVAAASSLTACGGSSPTTTNNASTTPPSTPTNPNNPTTPSNPNNPSPSAPPAGTYAFAQGVASGDPRSDSVVFWTRAAAVAGGANPVALQLQVSTTDDFGALVANVPLQALADYDFTVRAKVTGLSAATLYFYRFIAGSDISTTGTAKTAPDPSTANAQVRFAWFTCQDWTVNHWQAMNLIAAESDLDFVVHVGDYIYETVGASFQAGAAEPAHTQLSFPSGLPLPAIDGGGMYANTLDDYRMLYRTYRGDPRLQAIHRQFAMIAIWDDHEFSDDCWQDHQTYTNANLEQTSRRIGATQAWAEYMPIDWSDLQFQLNAGTFQNITIYRDFHFGQLVHMVMTDERLFRDDHVVSEAAIATAEGDDPVNGNNSIGSRYFVQQPVLAQFEAIDTATLGRPPSVLGPTQSSWLVDTMSASNATWKLWGNEVMLNRLWVDLTNVAPAPYNANYVINCDSWDGYPTDKAAVLTALKNANVTNLIAITGDLHAFQGGVVRDNPDPTIGTPVLIDFVCAGISSSSFYNYIKQGAQGTPLSALLTTPAAFNALLQANNPDLIFADHDAQGYASATVTPESFSVVYTKVKPLNADGTAPADPVLQQTRLTVPNGSYSINVESI